MQSRRSGASPKNKLELFEQAIQAAVNARRATPHGANVWLTTVANAFDRLVMNACPPR
jgi:hypothetical protein